MPVKLSSNELEAANRAEATALLIRAGYRVYRPEADVMGEDLILRNPIGCLLATQLKGRLSVDLLRYGGPERDIWMLFPDKPFVSDIRRSWFLVQHDRLFEWLKQRHGHSAKWNDAWSKRDLSDAQRKFLADCEIHPA